MGACGFLVKHQIQIQKNSNAVKHGHANAVCGHMVSLGRNELSLILVMILEL